MFSKQQNIPEDTDEELLQRYVDTGCTEHFGTLYSRYIPLVYGLCLKYFRDADTAQDNVMQLFEDLSKKIAGYEIKVFRTWLYSVAKNHCLQILRKDKKEIAIDFNAQLVESDIVLHLLEERPEKGEDKTEALNRCMEQLPEPQRVSIQHFFMEEKSYADVADATGYNLKSVKSYIQNGKRNLKICIEKIAGGFA